MTQTTNTAIKMNLMRLKRKRSYTLIHRFLFKNEVLKNALSVFVKNSKELDFNQAIAYLKSGLEG
ncbi:hypothetical protein HpNP16_10560 [Helicobacter pylori]